MRTLPAPRVARAVKVVQKSRAPDAFAIRLAARAPRALSASPPTIEVPANSALNASGGVVASHGPGYLSTG